MSKHLVEHEDCDVFWGSHGCDLPRGHDGNHKCLNAEDDYVCEEVDHTGRDPEGFQWHLYGLDAPKGSRP